jgi:catechol 2,3-dioxygenase-like lactoylglutathione lyase family enzyme
MSPPLVNVVTLGARDLDRLYGFYEAVGFPAVVTEGDMRQFELRGGVLALFGVESLAHDSGCEPGDPDGAIRFSIEILVETPEQVDGLAERVRTAGGRITKQPADAEFFTGRSCYFADPEGNFFEIAWAPRDNVVVAAARRAAGLPP